jgi:hypothetical protein
MQLTRVKERSHERHSVNVFLFLVLNVRIIITTISGLKNKNYYDITIYSYCKLSQENSHSVISSQIKYVKFLNYYIPSFICVRVNLLDFQYQSPYFSIQFNKTYKTAPDKAFGFAKSMYSLEKFRRTVLTGDWLVI